MGEEQRRVYVKCVLVGEPAWVLRELLRRGLACSVREAVAHGLLAYYDVVLERDLKRRVLAPRRRRSKGLPAKAG